jgi:DNA-3-methyladenine glycosylase
VPKSFDKKFFLRSALELAPQILGSKLIHETKEGLVSGIITEVEAYMGADDPASHAHRGPTPRNSVMFDEGGLSYVYFIYGMHYCFNITCGPKGLASALLVRAIHPLEGRELMLSRRRGKTKGWGGGKKGFGAFLCGGPSKLAQAFGIERKHNGLALLDRKSPLRLERALSFKKAQISLGPRIGISKAKDFPWRFLVQDKDLRALDAEC